MQTSQAFGQVHDSLSFFRESYADFASFRATLIRLNGLANDNQHAAELPILKTGKSGDDLQVEKLDVRIPTGQTLIEGLELTVTPGQSLLVKGPSGSGKTTLLRTLADLWPYADGTVSRPAGGGHLPVPAAVPSARFAADRAGVPERADGVRRHRARRAVEGVAPQSGGIGSTRPPTGRGSCRRVSSSVSRSRGC